MPLDVVVFRFAQTIAVGAGVAWLAAPLLRRPGTLIGIVAWLLAAGLLGLPLLIPSSAVAWRAVSLLACVEFSFKLLEYRRQALMGNVGDGLDDRSRYARFLSPLFPPFVVSWGERDREPSSVVGARGFGRLLLGGLCFAVGIAITQLRPGNPTSPAAVLGDHALRFAAFVIAIEGSVLGVQELERLAGFALPPLMRQILWSRTPAEFWTRYNTRIHRWLRDNVFGPAGGRRRPVWGTVLTFFVSAVFHEVAFGVATSVFDGAQFAFFLLQIPAVLLSPVLERLAQRGGTGGWFAAHAITIGWFFATSPLFFRGLERVFPFVTPAS